MKKHKYLESKPQTLLSVNHDAKTIKGKKKGYLTGILYLYPFKAFGLNLCPNALKADCHEPCLNTAGRGQMNMVQEARLRKTWLFHNDRDWFMRQLLNDIEALERKAWRDGLTPVVRLNGTSDLNWEDIRYEGESALERFSRMQYYDYTKLPRTPKNNNYHLTFSYSASPAYARTVAKALRLQMNIAVVFRGDFPTTFLGRKVVNGDQDDLRFLDDKNVVVALKAKGRAKSLESDLIVRAA
jgi:hypothetical protein